MGWAPACMANHLGPTTEPRNPWLPGGTVTSLASRASRRQTPCSRLDLQLPWGFLPQKMIRTLGQLLTRRRSLPEREHCAYVQWLAVGSRCWATPAHRKDRLASQVLLPMCGALRTRLQSSLYPEISMTLVGAWDFWSPPRNSSREVRFPMRL